MIKFLKPMSVVSNHLCLITWLTTALSNNLDASETGHQSNKAGPLGPNKRAETSAFPSPTVVRLYETLGMIPRFIPFFFSCSVKTASAFCRPVAWVLLSICQGDNFLPETLSLVIMARDKLCWNSWSLLPT